LTNGASTSAAEWVDRAFARLATGRTVTPEQQAWLGRIREGLVAHLPIGRDDFDAMPVLADADGWGRADRVFDGQLDDLIRHENEALAA
jgi:type I restriction enzyme, R subunit